MAVKMGMQSKPIIMKEEYKRRSLAERGNNPLLPGKPILSLFRGGKMRRTVSLIIIAGVLMGLVSFIRVSSYSTHRAVILLDITIGTWFFLWAMVFLVIRFSARLRLNSGEKILLEEWGAYYQEFGWVGGVINLTSSRLCFRSHIFNRIKKVEVDLPLDEVLNVSQEGRQVTIETKLFPLPLVFLSNDPSEWRRKLHRE